MADTKTSAQSIRRAARQAAVAAQAKRRAQAAERDKRLDAAALTLIVALRERDALERRAGTAIRHNTDGSARRRRLARRRDHCQGSHPAGRPSPEED